MLNKFKNLKNYITLNILSILGYLILLGALYIFFYIGKKYPYYPNKDLTYLCNIILLHTTCIIIHFLSIIFFIIEFFFIKYRKIKQKTLYTNPYLVFLFYIGICCSFSAYFIFNIAFPFIEFIFEEIKYLFS